MEKYQNKYRIPSARLPGFDYGSNNAYFITICTHQRTPYFGTVELDKDNIKTLIPTEIAMIAMNFWEQIPYHYPFVSLNACTLLPNHLHGILLFEKEDKEDWIPNKFGPQSQNLGAVIKGFKSPVKRFANNHQLAFEWQTRYHDHIIRDELSFQNIQNYIINNVANWEIDEFYQP